MCNYQRTPCRYEEVYGQEKQGAGVFQCKVYGTEPCMVHYEEDDGQEKQEAGVLSNPPNPTAEAKVNAPQHDIT